MPISDPLSFILPPILLLLFHDYVVLKQTMRSKNFKFTVGDIARVTGRTRQAVYNDRVRGVFDPEDLISMVEYLSGTKYKDWERSIKLDLNPKRSPYSG